MLPENFVPMLPEIAEVKYFSGKRPDEIYTSLDMSVNFTFTDLGISGNDQDTRLATGLIKQIIKMPTQVMSFLKKMKTWKKMSSYTDLTFKVME